MVILLLLLLMTLIASVCFNSVSIFNIILLSIGIICASIYIKRRSIYKNYASYILLSLMWFSTTFMPACHLVYSNENYVTITPQINNHILGFGIPVFSLTSIALLLSTYFKAGFVISKTNAFKPYIIPTYIAKFVMIASILLSVFCYLTGLGRMGADAVVLPYHLGGVINLFRSLMLPSLFVVLIEGFIIRKQRVPKTIWILYIIWCIFEIIAWLSKGVLLKNLAPAMFLLYIYFRPSAGKVLKIVSPLLFIFLFIYPIVEIMRYGEGGSLKDNIIEAQAEAYQDNDYSILKPLNRIFMYGTKFAQDERYINTDDLFDFSRFPSLIAVGGAARYQTFVIDGYPPGVNHSSGTCGVIDPLLHGGKGLVYLVALLLVLLALFIDKLIKKGYVSIAVILLQLLVFYIINENVTSFYDESGLQMYLVYAVTIYIAYQLNYKRKIIRSSP